MATYAELTDDQKADLAAEDKYLRGMFSSLTKLAKDMDAEVWEQFSHDRIDPILAVLDPTEEIPNSTGLTRAVPVTAAEFTAALGVARMLRAAMVDYRALLVKLIGVNAGG